MPPSLAERLRKAGIRHYDELIHDQAKDWLIKNFKAEGSAPAYPINVSRLMRNLVWQMKERVSSRGLGVRLLLAPPPQKTGD